LRLIDFHVPTLCSQCRLPLLGLTKQGLHCSRCKVHSSPLVVSAPRRVLCCVVRQSVVRSLSTKVMHLHYVLNCNVICCCLPRQPGMSFRPRLPCYSMAPCLVIASTSPKLLWTLTTYALSRELFVLYCGCPALINCEILLLIPLFLQLPTRPGWYVEVPEDTPFSIQLQCLPLATGTPLVEPSW
jgi:hypothetical protein